MNGPVLLYDGECKFCHWNVNQVLKYEKNHNLKFAWLQSPSIQDCLIKEGIPLDLDTLILYDKGKFYFKSKAVVHISKELQFPFQLMSMIRILPTSWADLCYDHIAKHRKKIMGSTSCVLPIGLENRFIS